MNTEQLQHTLEKNKLWLRDKGGQRADLRGANLYGANLYRADLYRADLSEADLSEADLRGANLYGANLCGSDLRGANLCGSDLRGAKGIMQFGPMPTSGRIIYAVRHDSGWMVQAGCFWGNLDELETAVKAKHNCPMYLEIIQLLRNTTNQ
jgi:hypothetical protein